MYIVAMLDAYASGRDFIVGRDIPDIMLSSQYDHSRGNGIRCNLSVSDKKYPDACRMLASVKPKCSGILIKNIIRFYLTRNLTNSLLLTSSDSTVISSQAAYTPPPAVIPSAPIEKISKDEERRPLITEGSKMDTALEAPPHAEAPVQDNIIDDQSEDTEVSELANLFGGLKFN